MNLKNTTFDPNKEKTSSNNFEHNGQEIIDYIYPGVIHDKKGRVAKQLGITTGHASLFTTAHDLMLFLKTFFDNTLLKQETIELMLKHNDINLYNYQHLEKLSSKTEINEMYKEVLEKDSNFYLPRTYNNMGTRYRNSIKSINDIPDKASDNSISFSGFTGPRFTIDFERKIIIIIMCNVMHNTKFSRKERYDKVNEIMNLLFERI